MVQQSSLLVISQRHKSCQGDHCQSKEEGPYVQSWSRISLHTWIFNQLGPDGLVEFGARGAWNPPARQRKPSNDMCFKNTSKQCQNIISLIIWTWKKSVFFYNNITPWRLYQEAFLLQPNADFHSMTHTIVWSFFISI